jgi:pimeloyl-ACP methyl ester carboxylesterase
VTSGSAAILISHANLGRAASFIHINRGIKMRTLGSILRRCGLAIAAFCLAPAAVAAPLGEFVVYKAEGGPCSGLCQPGANITGATLSGLLYSPKQPGRTGVVLVPQGMGGFIDGLHDYNPLAQQLMDAGYYLLLANMRTASGWTYERFESALPDVAAAVKTLKARGVENVILLGTSLGGPRIAYYAWKANEPSLKALIFMSSITSPWGEGRVRLSKEKLAAFDAFLERARQLVRDGKGKELVCFNYFQATGNGHCEPGGAGSTMSAASFLSMFGSPKDSDVNITNYGSQIKVPVAVVHSRHDEVSHVAIGQGIHDAFPNAKTRDLVWIDEPSISHYLSPGLAANRYAQEVVKWLTRNVPAK